MPDSELPDNFGRQVGAAGLDNHIVHWEPLAWKPVLTSSKRWAAQPIGGAGDGRWHTYWMSVRGENEWVVYDFGSAQTFDHLVLDLYSHFDTSNPKDIAFDASDDGQTWKEVLAAHNPDSEGSSYKYELPEPVTARYVRCRLLTNFGQKHFTVSDLRAWKLAAPGPGAAASDTRPAR